ncbi:probable calcium-binding protein CML31 [Coffea eugenioides]|uniref:probable calcium-binding protein CML31 n=1 Tax=Coffea eugenioides TaxID=49369 RepID=UPI000F60CBAA|nr:probable calcium-binding protein CML31 [Coffea eugenioides]
MGKVADSDGDGCIDFAEFTKVHRAKGAGVKGFKVPFEYLILDGNGKISAEELSEVMTRLGEKSRILMSCLFLPSKRENERGGIVGGDEKAWRKVEPGGVQENDKRGVDAYEDGFINMAEFMMSMTRTMNLSPS